MVTPLIVIEKIVIGEQPEQLNGHHMLTWLVDRHWRLAAQLPWAPREYRFIIHFRKALSHYLFGRACGTQNL